MICQRETSKKRASSRADSKKGAASATGPSSAMPPAAASSSSSLLSPSSSSGKASGRDEYVHRLLLAERRFDKGSVRSTAAFSQKLKRFGRAGLDDEGEARN